MDQIKEELKRTYIQGKPYFRYRLDGDKEVDFLSLSMLRNNKIEGLIPLQYVRDYQEDFLYYSLEDLLPLKSYLKGRMDKDRLLKLFRGLIQVMEELSFYLLEDNQLLLDSDYIFIDPKEDMIMLLLLPFNHLEKQNPIYLFKSLLIEFSYQSAEDTAYLGKIVNYLNENNFVLSQFAHFIDSLKEDKEKKDVRKPRKNRRKDEDQGLADEMKDSKKDRVKEKVKKDQENEVDLPDILFDEPVSFFASPLKKKKEKNQNREKDKPEGDMTLFYLLTHFSKENWDSYFNHH